MYSLSYIARLRYTERTGGDSCDHDHDDDLVQNVSEGKTFYELSWEAIAAIKKVKRYDRRAGTASASGGCQSII